MMSTLSALLVGARRLVHRQYPRSLFSSLPETVASIAGQPTCETHPELLAEKEVQPGITNEEFCARRQRFADQLAPGSLAILGAGPTQYMSGIIPYPYRPNSCFQYLTGIIQPDTLATIDSSGRFVVYTPDESEFRNTWTGPLMDTRAAMEVFGADDAYVVSEIGTRLKRAIQSSRALYLDLNASAAHLATADHWRLALQVMQELQDEARPVHGFNSIIHRMRWKKSAAEVALMRTSAQVAAEAMTACMVATGQRSSRSARSEHDVSALFEYECRVRGAQRMAYPPVVAAGADATTIHYSRNDKVLRPESRDLLLVDAGCEYYGYCSDVTRTWPVSGRFEGAHRDVYQAVYETHAALLRSVRPGVTLRQLHHMSVDLLRDALRSLGLSGHAMIGPSANDYRIFYPHSVGHWLGLDTHDSASVSHDLPLDDGVCLTIEPGLYIPDEDRYGHFRGIGVRIEDDVLFVADGREGGAEVLSATCPTSVEEIESLLNL